MQSQGGKVQGEEKWILSAGACVWSWFLSHDFPRVCCKCSRNVTFMLLLPIGCIDQFWLTIAVLTSGSIGRSALMLYIFGTIYSSMLDKNCQVTVLRDDSILALPIQPLLSMFSRMYRGNIIIVQKYCDRKVFEQQGASGPGLLHSHAEKSSDLMTPTRWLFTPVQIHTVSNRWWQTLRAEGNRWLSQNENLFRCWENRNLDIYITICHDSVMRDTCLCICITSETHKSTKTDLFIMF